MLSLLFCKVSGKTTYTQQLDRLYSSSSNSKYSAHVDSCSQMEPVINTDLVLIWVETSVNEQHMGHEEWYTPTSIKAQSRMRGIKQGQKPIKALSYCFTALRKKKTVFHSFFRLFLMFSHVDEVHVTIHWFSLDKNVLRFLLRNIK